MVFSVLKQESYEQFTKQLIEKAQREPFDICYSVIIVVNKTEYLLKVKPEKKYRVYALSALKVDRHNNSCQLIADNVFLLSLLNILIRQGIG